RSLSPARWTRSEASAAAGPSRPSGPSVVIASTTRSSSARSAERDDVRAPGSAAGTGARSRDCSLGPVAPSSSNIGHPLIPDKIEQTYQSGLTTGSASDVDVDRGAPHDRGARTG